MKLTKGEFILEVLDSFPMVELKDIRHYFGAKMPSGIRKSEFVDKLRAYIIESPEQWLKKMLERDLRLLKKLVLAGPEVPVYLDYPDFPSVLETVKLISSDTSDDNFRKVWIPKELYDIVSPYIDKAIEYGETSGAFEADRAALGYLAIYGVLTTEEFFVCMADYWDQSQKMSMEEFTKHVSESPVMKLCRSDIGDVQCVSSPNILDPDEIVNARQNYPDIKGLKPYTPAQALEAGAGSPYFVFDLGSENGIRLVEMLTKLGYKGEDLIREEHDIWMNSQMVDHEDVTEELFSAVSRKQDDLDTFEEYNDCMEIVVAYANSLPKWLLRGYSSEDVNCLRVVLQSEVDPVDQYVRKHPLMGLFVHPVPADSPCPCGSGLSYKMCHGRHLN